MKKLFVILILLLMLIPISGAGALQADHYPGQLHYYDVQIDLMSSYLAAFQAEYHAVNGRYYQALQSHDAAPDVPNVPGNIHRSPTDQVEDLAYFWDTVAELPGSLAWSFRIDTYSGPDGDGYVLGVVTVIHGETWTRSVNYGPDAWRGSDWYQVVEE